VHDTGGFAGDEVDDRLVVLELDGGPCDLLLGVLLLLQAEDVLVEEELQRLVRVVDAQLLKTVVGKVLVGKIHINKSLVDTQMLKICVGIIVLENIHMIILKLI
jgi:hypothetical protein